MNLPFYQPTYNPTRNNGITWVQGLEGAKAFQLAPNSTIVLMDSESDCFYIKTCDDIGMCHLRHFKYTEVDNTPPSVDLSQYCTKSDVENIVREVMSDYGKQTLPTDARHSKGNQRDQHSANDGVR